MGKELMNVVYIYCSLFSTAFCLSHTWLVYIDVVILCTIVMSVSFALLQS